MAAANGWVFSSDVSPEQLAEMQGLVAANGLSSAVGATSDAAEEAFARMVASNPNATVVGEPPASGEASVQAAAPLACGGWVFSPDLSPESLAQVQGMIAANGLSASNGVAGAGDDTAARAGRAAAADAAFARMVATNPNATVIDGGPRAASVDGGGAPGSEEVRFAPPALADGGEGDPSSAAAEAAFASLLEANPGAKEVAPGVYMVGHDEPPVA
eukprot:CAMPEP_0119088556 /NCGR_PEP_ID=MMETSP1178-20130426/145883_1 /TAXON_ID=33656 /ORGANISM="unid sp, Strain CCMP2000" /LENGTH=215 /DNA_ID=CAMNT_0007071851 /DNA_START=69 /DNA_END=716 /DNA_ORIENTATION=+